jgi:hypothetical protein
MNKYLGMGINCYSSNFTMEINNKWGKKMDVKTKIQHIIPTFNVRVFDRQNKGAFLASAGFGFVNYKTTYSYYYTEKGSTIGLLLSAGYDVPLSKVIAIYVNASINTGLITTITIDKRNYNYSQEGTYYTQEGEGVGVGKINLSLGLRFAK